MTMLMKIREEREDAAINATIRSYRELNAADNAIIKSLIKNFDLTEEEAKERIENYHSVA